MRPHHFSFCVIRAIEYRQDWPGPHFGGRLPQFLRKEVAAAMAQQRNWKFTRDLARFIEE